MPKKTMRKKSRSKKNTKVATKTYVKKILHKTNETKYYELGATPGNVDFNGSLVLLTGLSQGTTDSQRIGDKINLRAFKIHYQLLVGDAYNTFRIIIFQWKPNTQLVTPTVANILVGTTVGTVNAPLANYVWDYQNQFIVLYDKLHVLDALNMSTKAYRKTVKLKFAKKTIEYYAASTAASNHLYMLCISDSGAAAHPTIQYQTRVMYDDS